MLLVGSFGSWCRDETSSKSRIADEADIDNTSNIQFC